MDEDCRTAQALGGSGLPNRLVATRAGGLRATENPGSLRARRTLVQRFVLKVEQHVLELRVGALELRLIEQHH